MKRAALLATVFAFALSAPALGHTGIGATHGFVTGFGHPFGGADHVLAMVAVGLWAALLGGRALWMVPLAFIAAMAGGGLLGAYGIALPFVEAGILVSIVALGTLAAFNIRMHTVAAIAIAALFAVFHGHAHGAEMPQDASGIEYALGFMVATAALHGFGLAVGTGLIRAVQSRLVRAMGAAVAAAGAALFVLG